jgi:hypothetical protein
MQISAISNQRETCYSYKLQNQFPAGNAGNFSAVNVNGLSAISSLQ